MQRETKALMGYRAHLRALLEETAQRTGHGRWLIARMIVWMERRMGHDRWEIVWMVRRMGHDRWMIVWMVRKMVCGRWMIVRMERISLFGGLGEKVCRGRGKFLRDSRAEGAVGFGGGVVRFARCADVDRDTGGVHQGVLVLVR